MAAKKLKNPYRLQTVTLKLSWKGKKTKIRKEKPQVTYSVSLVMVFHAAENENRQLKDLPQAYTENVSVILVGIWWRENNNKLVEWKALIDTVEIKSADLKDKFLF